MSEKKLIAYPPQEAGLRPVSTTLAYSAAVAEPAGSAALGLFT